MALNTFTDLVASINNSAGWLHRNDLAAIVPDWVTLCETTINMGDPVKGIKGLRTADQETITTLATTSGSPWVDLPDDFLEARKLTISFSGANTRELPIRPTVPLSRAEETATASVPQQAVIIGNRLYLTPAANGVYPIGLVYYAKVGPLATQGTNWLLTAAPMVYLHGSIAHGGPWLGATFNPQPWIQGFASGMAQVSRMDAKKRFGNARLRCEAATINGAPYNGNTGI